MAVIKCKMCGGDIELAPDKTFGTCEYCGSTMTLPKIDDEQRAAAFNRGNHFRRIGEFDKALAIYENIVREDENDAEAHWCCALCRFGIEYVEDPATYEWLPTCHRLSFDSFLEDVDYLAALEHSDGITRRQYQKDAAKIAEVQRGILATSQNAEPYDVFICYKETDDKGQRTRDSILAQDIYYQLTEQGRRVFFARITLEDVAGTQYEPYIFAALNSAKVMLVIGTSSENLNAVWVKNEWSRYLALMKKDRSKLLLPCYRDMDPYDLPEQLSVLQSYDMGKIGFIQDLLRGVSKVLDSGKKEAVKETVVVQQQGGTNVDALLQRGKMALEDGDWDKADGFYEEVLNHSAQNARAYIGKALVAEKQTSLENLVKARLAQLDDTEYETLYLQRDVSHIDEMVGLAVPGYFDESEIRKSYDSWDLSYWSKVKSREQQREQEMNWWQANKNLSRAITFAAGAEKTELTTALQTLKTELDRRVEEAREQEAASKTKEEEKYRNFLQDNDNYVRHLSEDAQNKRESEYQKHLNILQTSDDRGQLSDAKSFFRGIADYKDSSDLIKQCSDKIDALNAAERKQQLEKKKRNTFVGIVVAVLVIAAIIAVFVVVKVVIPANKYNAAEELLAAGDYDGAIAAFEALGDYKDSAERILAIQYSLAEDMLASGNYEEAIAAFTELGDNKDAPDRISFATDRIKESEYGQAEALLSEGKTQEAAFAFGRASGYKDAAERSYDLWADRIVPLAIPGCFNSIILGLKADGTVVSAGEAAEENDIADWTDIIAISASWHTVGLKSDGTVVASGSNTYGECDVSEWKNIVGVAAGIGYTVGLKTDGTVVKAGDKYDEQYGISDWKDIVAITSSGFHTLGLKSDGTVVATGSNTDGQCRGVSDWTDIVAVAAGFNFSVGLKSDGTVVTAGSNSSYQRNVSDWHDIVAIAVGDYYTVGLKSDGTVVATGSNLDGALKVSDWHDIVAIAAGFDNTIGLKSDGTVVAAGNNDAGQCNVSGWKNMLVPKKS